MAGADDHARQPRGVEHALFLVEVPAAALLRHKAALEPVGEPGDDMLQPGQLAVEIGPQTVELFGIAQLGRGDFLVELARIDLVFEIVGNVGPVAVRAHGHHALFAVVASVVAVAVLFRELALAILVGVAFGHFGGGFGALLRRLVARVFLVGIVLGRLALVLVAFVVGIFGRTIDPLDQIELTQHLDRKILKRLLVVELVGKRREIAAGALVDEIANEIDALLRALGDRLTGERLAHHQRNGGGERHVARFDRAGDRVTGGAQLGRSGEVLAHTCKALRAQRLVADLLDRIIHRARHRIAGSARIVQRIVVQADLECETIGKAARFGGLLGRQLPPGQRHAEVLARRAGAVRAPRDFHLGLTRDRPRATGQRALEPVERSFFAQVRTCLRECSDRSTASPSGSLRYPCQSARG